MPKFNRFKRFANSGREKEGGRRDLSTLALQLSCGRLTESPVLYPSVFQVRHDGLRSGISQGVEVDPRIQQAPDALQRERRPRAHAALLVHRRVRAPQEAQDEQQAARARPVHVREDLCSTNSLSHVPPKLETQYLLRDARRRDNGITQYRAFLAGQHSYSSVSASSSRECCSSASAATSPTFDRGSSGRRRTRPRD